MNLFYCISDVIHLCRHCRIDSLFNLTYVHSFFPFMVSFEDSSSIKTASVIFLVVGSPKQFLRILTLTGNLFPWWCNWECLCNGLESSFLVQSSKCWFIGSWALFPVCPLYLLSHSLQSISYTQPRALQFTPVSSWQIIHFSFPHVSCLNGLLFCSSFRTLSSTFSIILSFSLFFSAHFCISFF